MSQVIELNTKAEFDSTIAKACDKLVVVDFTAAWCGPCQRIKPRFAELANEFAHVIFAKVDVDSNKETARACNIKAMPTFHFYKAGTLVHTVQGADPNKLHEGIVAHSGDKWSQMQGHTLSGGAQSTPDPAAAPAATNPRAAAAEAAERRAATAAAAEKRMAAQE